ncbi:MAG TPA: hypothetical protein VJN62_15355 [Gemmatimonadales bacterium]|nr:hypothetical protein [Gemmatimonadales bacterium]
MNDDDRFEQELKRMAQDYHRPPETPRDEMWARITAERARRRETAGAAKVVPLRRWMTWSAAAAAVLALGIGIGRWSMGPGRSAALAARPDSNLVYRVAAMPYLTRTEALLTSFRAESRSGKVNTDFAAQAQDLLVTTRLMLNSPAARDPRLANLLQDLEVMLVQIAQLPARNDRNDVDLINQGLDQRSVMLRLRAIGTAPGATPRGAL